MEDILIESELFLHVKGFLKTQKVKKYGVLHGRTEDQHPFLEIYDSEDDFDNKKKVFKNIDLKQIRAITNQVQNSSKGVEYHMEIQTKKEKVQILFESEDDSSSWSSKLNGLVNHTDKHDENSVSSMTGTGESENDEDECTTLNAMYGGALDVQRFEVKVESTDLSRLCGIEGNHTLLVSESSLAFESHQTKRIVYTFQLQWMRRFGRKETVFNFEVGRQCPNGPGDIKLKTDKAKFIHNMVQEKSKSRGTTVTPAPRQGIAAAKDNVKHVIEPKIQDGISGPALHVPKRHPGLGTGPALIPIQRDASSDESSPAPKRDSSKRESVKSLNSDSPTGKLSGSGKHGTASEEFTKKLENTFSNDHKESTKTKDKERDSKKKEKEEKENRKKEEKKEKERREREKKEEKKQKEKAKKEEKKQKDKIPSPPNKPVPRAAGLYEEVDIVNESSSPSPNSKARFSEQHPLPELSNHDDDLYDEAGPTTNSGEPVEYAQPMTRKAASFRPTEYSDVNIVRGNAWKSQGREEDEEEHIEDYSKIKEVRDQSGAPPLPDRMYEDEVDDDETYNRVDLKAPKSRGTKQKAQMETQNIYGTASETKVGPVDKKIVVPEPDYDESDSGESIHDDTYDNPDVDTYDQPSNVTAKKPNISSYEEAVPKPSVRRKVHEESLYDEVS